jgi:hypothetical protein
MLKAESLSENWRLLIGLLSVIYLSYYGRARNAIEENHEKAKEG